MEAKRYFLNVGCELLIEQEPKYRVLMANPETLSKEKNLWSRLLCTFGKYEVENWISEELIDISKKAVAEKKSLADFSKISQVEVLYEDNGEWKTLVSKECFRKRFCLLPFFRVLKEADDVTILEYIP